MHGAGLGVKRKFRVRRFMVTSGEQFLESLLPILENPVDITPHKKPVDQRPAPGAIAHTVEAEGAAVALLKSVGMMPYSVCRVKTFIS